MASKKIKKKLTTNYTPIGWREWIYLPKYKNFPIKAKIDTGATSSALNAYDIAVYKKGNQSWVRFKLKQYKRILKINSKLIKQKKITSSFGDTEIRPVIKMKIKLGNQSWDTEVTLAMRSSMTYPMLIGRSSLKKKHIIHSHKSYLTGKNNFVL